MRFIHLPFKQIILHLNILKNNTDRLFLLTRNDILQEMNFPYTRLADNYYRVFGTSH